MAVPAAVLLLALALRLWVARSATILEVDGAYWCGLARALVSGDLAHGLHAAWPPLYPAAIALTTLVLPDPGSPDGPARLEWAARVVSALAGTLVLLPLGALARRFVPRRWALAAMAIAAVHPRLVEYSAMALSESLFTLLLVGALAALAAAEAATLAGPRARGAAVAGAGFGLAYLARPEGLLLGLAALGVAALRGRRVARASAITLVAGLAAMLLVAGPWLVFLHRDTGAWTLGEKGAYNFWRAHRDAYALHFPPPVALPARVNRSPEIAPLPIPGEVRPWAVFAAEPARVSVTTLRHLGELVVSTFPVASTWPVVALAVLGIPAALAGGGAATLVAPIVAAILVVAPFSHDRRLLVPIVPLAVVLAVLFLRGRAARPGGAWAATVAALLGMGLMVYTLGIPKRLDRAPELRVAGEWLAAHAGDAAGDSSRVPGRPVVMARKPQVAFYAGGLIADLPDAPPAAILEDARRTGADVLVIDARAARGDRPQIAAWLDPLAPPRGWRLARRWEGESPIALFVRAKP